MVIRDAGERSIFRRRSDNGIIGVSWTSVPVYATETVLNVHNQITIEMEGLVTVKKKGLSIGLGIVHVPLKRSKR